MEEKAKNNLIFVFAGMSLLFFVFTVSSCNATFRQKLARDKEMATRLNLEERMSKFSQEKAKVDEKNKAMEKELLETQSALDSVKKALQEEQMVNQSLKDELAKTAKVKEGLEEEIKNIQAKAKKNIR